VSAIEPDLLDLAPSAITTTSRGYRCRNQGLVRPDKSWMHACRGDFAQDRAKL